MQDVAMNGASKNEEPGKLLLISMPFALPHTPSIQLGTLSAYLKNKGIAVDAYHAYLTCADILSHELAYILSYLPTEEFFYTSFLFPDNFKKHRNKIEKKYNKAIQNLTCEQPLSFQTVLDKIDSFNQELLTTIDFSSYSLIGFSITFDQLRPSIYLAREIKRRHPHIPIVFGGVRCADDLGVSLLKTFPEIDFVVSGEGEETLRSLFLNLQNKKFDQIKGLVWRDNTSVTFNGPPEKLPADGFAIPDYGDYFAKLEMCSPEFKNLVKGYLAIPIEGSRGCWWNKCTFCNLNMQFSGYREKPIERILHEVSSQVEKYQCHSIKFVDNIQSTKDFDAFMTGLIDLNKDLNIFLEIRACLSKEDYRLMQRAGVKVVQIGIEAFGNGMLEKMNKGVTTIENVAALKYCQEFGIIPIYNVIGNYPNETEDDLKETAENVKFLTNFHPPVNISNMLLGHKSRVYCNAHDFNIKEMSVPKNALLFYPKEVCQTLLPNVYDYTRIEDAENDPSAWQEIFREWKQVWDESKAKPLLYFQDATDFLTITDTLSKSSPKCILREIEREVYLFCDTIQTKETILKQFPSLTADHLEEMVEEWVAHRWMFREKDSFLSLAIRLDSGMPPLTYFSQIYPYTEKFLARFKAPLEKSRGAVKLPAWVKFLGKK